jgi:hypothetical protein
MDPDQQHPASPEKAPEQQQQQQQPQTGSGGVGVDSVLRRLKEWEASRAADKGKGTNRPR